MTNEQRKRIEHLIHALEGLWDDLRELNSRHENRGTVSADGNPWREGVAHGFELAHGFLWDLLDGVDETDVEGSLANFRADVDADLARLIAYRVKR